MVHEEQVPGLVSVAVLVTTALLGPEFAVAVGAYGAIVLGWFGGMLVGLWRMPPVPRLQLAGFVVVSLVLTLGVTVSVAELLTQAMRATVPWAGGVKITDALMPVAFLLPAIGHNWVNVARWVWSLRPRALQNKGDESS